MTPKEKAKELFDKYQIAGSIWYVDRTKNYASIAVDEIIKSREDDGAFDDTLSSTSSEYYTPHPMYLTYWLQVKQELEKL